MAPCRIRDLVEWSPARRLEFKLADDRDRGWYRIALERVVWT